MNRIEELPIVNYETLENYWNLDFSSKGKLIESIGTQFLHFYSLRTKEITSKMLQKTHGDTVATLVIPGLANKQVTADFKAGGHSRGYNDLCVDIQYLTKEGTPKLVSGTNIGWLFTTVSDFIIAIIPKSRKLYFISWNNALKNELIRAYSLYCDGIEQLPSWVIMDTITIDKYKNTQVLRVNLEQLMEQFPEFISDYKIISMESYFRQLEGTI